MLSGEKIRLVSNRRKPNNVIKSDAKNLTGFNWFSSRKHLSVKVEKFKLCSLWPTEFRRWAKPVAIEELGGRFKRRGIKNTLPNA